MEERKQIVYDLLVVSMIIISTDILAFDFLPQFYLPSIILWALMPFIVELVVRKGTLRNLGFQRTSFRKSLPLIFGLIIVWILAYLLTLKIKGINTPLSTGSLIFIASVFFHPGLVEELNFRGFLQTRLERLFSVRKALVIQATAFGLYHIPPMLSGSPGAFTFGGQFYPFFAFLFGIVMGIIYIRTRNLFVCIGFHASLFELLLISSIFISS